MACNNYGILFDHSAIVNIESQERKQFAKINNYQNIIKKQTNLYI